MKKPPPPPIALILSLEEEFLPYRKLFGDLTRVDSPCPWEIYETAIKNRRVLFMIADCGPACAAASAERMIAEFKPGVILHGGSAGGLNIKLFPGDIVVGNKYVVLASKETIDSRRALGLHPSLLRYRKGGRRTYLDHIAADGRLLSMAWEVVLEILPSMPGWSGPGAHEDSRRSKFVVGTVGSADTWTTSAAEVERLYAEYGAECEDMESAYIALICSLHDVPFLAIRAISDSQFHQQLDPADLNAALAAAGEISALVVHGIIGKLAGSGR